MQVWFWGGFGVKDDALPPCRPQGARQRPHPGLALRHALRLPGDHGAGEGGHVHLDPPLLRPHPRLRGRGQRRLHRLLQQHPGPEQPLPHEELAGTDLRFVSPGVGGPKRWRTPPARAAWWDRAPGSPWVECSVFFFLPSLRHAVFILET